MNFLDLNSLFSHFLNRSFFAEHVLRRLLQDRRLDSVLSCELFLFVEHNRHWLLWDMLDKLCVFIQVFEQLIHDVFRCLLVDFWHRLARLHRLFRFQARTEHKLVDRLIVFLQLSLLFSTFGLIILIFPNLATIVFVAKTLVVNNEVVVPSRVLSALVLCSI